MHAAGPSTAASGTGIPPPPPLTATPPSSEATSGLSVQPSNDEETKGKIPNPGPYDDVHRKAKDLFPVPLTGCKLMISKGLSPHFSVTHTLMLDQQQPSSYTFGATYAGANQVSPVESFPVMMGEMDTSGSLNSQIIHLWRKELKSKFIVQSLRGHFQGLQCDLEYRGPTYTAAIALANPDLLSMSGMLVANYQQSMSPNVVLGAELMYQRSGQDQGSLLSFIGRYSTNSFIATASVNRIGLHLSYFHKGTPNSRVAIEFQSSTVNQESFVTAGYQLDYPKANMSFRSSVDTNWTVISTVEKKLFPLPCSLILSGLLNHQKQKCLFGMGITVG